jgi:hypothetical protein
MIQRGDVAREMENRITVFEVAIVFTDDVESLRIR